MVGENGEGSCVELRIASQSARVFMSHDERLGYETAFRGKQLWWQGTRMLALGKLGASRASRFRRWRRLLLLLLPEPLFW